MYSHGQLVTCNTAAAYKVPNARLWQDVQLTYTQVVIRAAAKECDMVSCRIWYP